ncbi:MAG: hypothetical protein WC539_06110 [Nitrospirota bacterium]
MKHGTWQILLGIVLIGTSVLLYSAQISIFKNPHESFFLLFQDLAFVPIHFLLITLIVDRLLILREKKALVNKLNMVIGIFFSEMGIDLLKKFVAHDPGMENKKNNFLIANDWTDRLFSETIKNMSTVPLHVVDIGSSLPGFKTFLISKKAFLLQLLENPSLLEHATFSELLLAIFHLAEELEMRDNVSQLFPADEKHLAGDMERIYTILVAEWLAYMKHLKREYPYLFSLAMRKNPFDADASVIIQ